MFDSQNEWILVVYSNIKYEVHVLFEIKYHIRIEHEDLHLSDIVSSHNMKVEDFREVLVQGSILIVAVCSNYKSKTVFSSVHSHSFE